MTVVTLHPDAIIADKPAPPAAGGIAHAGLSADYRGVGAWAGELRASRKAKAKMAETQGHEDTIERMTGLLTAVAVQRDRAAFKVLFEFYAPRLKAFVQRQGTSPDMAEEVVQETMVKVWRKAAQFDASRASASTWIFTIARNLRVDLLRKANRPAPDMNDPALVPEPEPRAHELISRDQESARLKVAVAELPQEQQEVLRLAFFEEKAHGAVAEELGIPLGTVKSRIRLAFKRIRAELGEEL